MPTRFLSDVELAQLSGFPADIAAEDLVTYFTLAEVDRRWLFDEHRGAANQLGAGCSCAPRRGLASSPDDLTTAPPAVVGRLADQLNLGVGALADYGGATSGSVTPHTPKRFGHVLNAKDLTAALGDAAFGWRGLRHPKVRGIPVSAPGVLRRGSTCVARLR